MVKSTWQHLTTVRTWNAHKLMLLCVFVELTSSWHYKNSWHYKLRILVRYHQSAVTQLKLTISTVNVLNLCALKALMKFHQSLPKKSWVLETPYLLSFAYSLYIHTYNQTYTVYLYFIALLIFLLSMESNHQPILKLLIHRHQSWGAKGLKPCSCRYLYLWQH